MTYWKHRRLRGGRISYGMRKGAGIRGDGVFEAPDEPRVTRRLQAAGHVCLGAEAPAYEAPVKRAASAKARRIEARVARRAAEGSPVSEPEPRESQSEVTLSTPGPVEVSPEVKPPELQAQKDQELADLQGLVEEHGIDTNATTAPALKRALTAAGIDWRAALEA